MNHDEYMDARHKSELEMFMGSDVDLFMRAGRKNSEVSAWSAVEKARSSDAAYQMRIHLVSGLLDGQNIEFMVRTHIPLPREPLA